MFRLEFVFCFDFWLLDATVCAGPGFTEYHHSGLIAFVLRWSSCNKQPAFCNIAEFIRGLINLKRDQGTDRPVYKSKEDVDKGSNTDELLDNIEEASGFWKELWETPGTGDASASWLEEMKEVIREHVPLPAEEEWDLQVDEVVKTVKKKKNWSAPGPDKISNY